MATTCDITITSDIAPGFGGISESMTLTQAGNLTDIDTSMTPFQAGLSGIVDLDKKNFVGQKALLKSVCFQIPFLLLQHLLKMQSKAVC